MEGLQAPPTYDKLTTESALKCPGHENGNFRGRRPSRDFVLRASRLQRGASWFESGEDWPHLLPNEKASSEEDITPWAGRYALSQQLKPFCRTQGLIGEEDDYSP